MEFWKDFENLYTNPTIVRLFVLFVAMVVVAILSGVARRALNRSITDTDRKYRSRKAVTFIAYLAVLVIALFIYGDQLGNVGVALGVVGAGIAFALQEVIVSIAGWLTIMIGGAIGVGQRVKIGDVKGDVIDIGVFRTSIMEIGDWVDGDLYNGRIVWLSNSFVYKEKVHNYSGEYPFLWDEMKIPIRFESDLEKAKMTFEAVLNEVCGAFTEKSRKKWLMLTNKYRVESAIVDPMVTMQFDENWVTFTLRYIVDYKLRRATKDRIARLIYQKIQDTDLNVRIAASSLEVTQM
ncbi:MAG: mechanosensitive ion channel [Cryomorphaceae bacterium]